MKATSADPVAFKKAPHKQLDRVQNPDRDGPICCLIPVQLQQHRTLCRWRTQTRRTPRFTTQSFHFQIPQNRQWALKRHVVEDNLTVRKEGIRDLKKILRLCINKNGVWVELQRGNDRQD
jgi:uncharacterized protein YcgL (UPF0745 family)